MLHETKFMTYFAKSNSKHHLTKLLTSVFCMMIFITEKQNILCAVPAEHIISCSAVHTRTKHQTLGNANSCHSIL